MVRNDHPLDHLIPPQAKKTTEQVDGTFGCHYRNQSSTPKLIGHLGSMKPFSEGEPGSLEFFEWTIVIQEDSASS